MATADPIFAAIGAARRSLAMLRALGDASAPDKEFDAASIAYDDLVRELLRTVPTTLIGQLAYVRYIKDCEDAGDNVLTIVMDEEEDSTDVMLATIVASLEQLAAGQELP
jgi:hypothetical protein